MICPNVRNSVITFHRIKCVHEMCARNVCTKSVHKMCVRNVCTKCVHEMCAQMCVQNVCMKLWSLFTVLWLGNPKGEQRVG